VFNINGRDIPIVHRVIKVHERAAENHLDILTKVSGHTHSDWPHTQWPATHTVTGHTRSD
jgi:hypothetical protein